MEADGYEETDGRMADRGHNLGGNFTLAKTEEEEALEKAKTNKQNKTKQPKNQKPSNQVKSWETRLNGGQSFQKAGSALSNPTRRIKP